VAVAVLAAVGRRKTKKPMSNLEPKIPEELTLEVFALASRLYSQASQKYSLAELERAGLEAQIPPEFIRQAVREIYKRKIQAQKRQLTAIAALLGLGLAICLWSVATYNTLNDAEQKVDAAWAQVENQFQRRSDLIPNLIAVTQTYTTRDAEGGRERDHRNLVAELKRSRQSYLQAATPAQKVNALSQIDLAVVQFQEYLAKNPQLQSAQAITNLEYELTGTENRIAVERMRYNQAVQAYNRQVKSFPNSLLSPVFGFHVRSFFQAQPNAPAVDSKALIVPLTA